MGHQHRFFSGDQLEYTQLTLQDTTSILESEQNLNRLRLISLDALLPTTFYPWLSKYKEYKRFKGKLSLRDLIPATDIIYTLQDTVRLTAGSTPPPPGDFLLCAPDADILRACDIYISTATMQKRWPPDLYWRDSLSESVTQRLAPSIAILHNLIHY